MNAMNNRNYLVPALILVLGIIAAAPIADAENTRSSTGHGLNMGVKEVAMVTSSGPDTLVLDVDGDRDGTLYLNYTAVNAEGAYRMIFVSWRAGNRAPSGTSLRIRAASVPARAGTAGGEVTVSDHPAAIIRGIPSCTTGRGSSGALIEYRLSDDDPSQIHENEATTVTLVFTMSEDL
jgi:hypothetical protein